MNDGKCTAIRKTGDNQSRTYSSREKKACLTGLDTSVINQYLENCYDCQSLGIGKDRRRNDLVGTESLTRVDKPSKISGRESSKACYEAKILPTFL